MKKLSRKVFLSIFAILSLFVLFLIFVYNLQNYNKEYGNVFNSLNFIEDFKFDRRAPRQTDTNFIFPEERNLDNMMFIDYEVYTVKLSDGNIERIIGHGDYSDDFDVESIAFDIIEDGKDLRIGNLYFSNYAYNYILDDTIVIVNTKSISNKLKLMVLESFLFLLLSELVIYFISKIMTKWITKPAIESFDKQKDFIADASHELKTPLAVIMASSDELKSDKKNSKYVENIKYESERMNKLITGLLDLSKIENGVSIENYKEENISKIIEKICLTFEGVAFEQNITIDSNIEDNIMFKCSKEEIEKLISILLDNAIKHSYSNSSIVVNLNKEKNNINLEVINSGDPINSGDEEKIFERFYRADKSRKREGNRYGLGLAIAKKIVTNHNGTIKAYSKDGLTTFKIYLKK